MTVNDRYRQALSDPSGVFDTPEAILEDAELTREQKIEVLRRIMIALGTLTSPIDVDHTPPSKQHGLPRSSVKPRK